MNYIPRSLAFDMLFGGNKGDAHETLSKIYDSIIGDFESRICENCIHWKQENNTQKKTNKGMCKQHSDKDKYYTIGITNNDYGCNRFEKKEK